MAELFSSEPPVRGLATACGSPLPTASASWVYPSPRSQISRAAGSGRRDLDFERVAEIERETRHDVVSHLRHFAEQAGDAGSILHLGATSAFITDNTDLMLMREALDLLRQRTATVVGELADFARRRTREIPTLAFTHLQPAQLTTVGKRACIWMQDFLLDLEAQGRFLKVMKARGVKGTTGTQASYLTLFDEDHTKVPELDRLLAQHIGFTDELCLSPDRPIPANRTPKSWGCWPDSVSPATSWAPMSGCSRAWARSRSRSVPRQVGSSAMAYKRNPIRSERMCALSRRLITDSLNGPLTAATQWLERSLDDSANRRLVYPIPSLLADAILGLAAGIVHGLTVNESRIRFHVGRELPFMATESLLMKATLKGGDRQHLHEVIRQHSMTAHEAVARGDENPLIELLEAGPPVRPRSARDRPRSRPGPVSPAVPGNRSSSSWQRSSSPL